MKLQSAYLDALDSNDIEKLREIQMQLEKSTPLPRELRKIAKKLNLTFTVPVNHI